MSSVTELARQLDPHLRLNGFSRRASAWNRAVDGVVDVVHLQLAKGGEDLWVNLAVVDLDVCGRLYGPHHRAFFDEALGTVRTRLGRETTGRDVAWSVRDPGASSAISSELDAEAWRFFERHHSREALIRALREARGKGPAEQLMLGLLLYEIGSTADACAVVDAVANDASGAWSHRARSLASEMECPT